MANVTAAMIKALREKTGAGMMDCKKALVESDGNEEMAIDWLRKKGVANAADGTVTDTFVNAVAIIGEKITLRRFEIVEKADDEEFGAYMHQGGRISALVVVKGSNDPQVAKNMAMQVASMNPTYVSRNEMPQEKVEHERQILMDQLASDEKLANKPEKVKAGIVEGRLSKELQDMCLVDQIFFLDQDLKCGQYLKNNNAEVLSFVKYTVGEGIEKKQDDFAAEVAAMAQK